MYRGTLTLNFSAITVGVSIILGTMLGCGDDDNSSEENAPVLAAPSTGTGVMSPVGMATSPNSGGMADMPSLGGVPEQSTADMGGTAMQEDNTTPPVDAPASQPTASDAVVTATMRILNPGAFGAGYSGVSVTSDLGMAQTDQTGTASVDVAQGAYEVRLTANNARPHTVFGFAKDTPFTQITYMSPEMICRE